MRSLLVANLKVSFEAAAAERQDVLQTAVIGWHDNDKDRWVANAYKKVWPIEPWDTAASKLDLDYNAGFGGADCHAAVVWGKKFVYFVHEYDGATKVYAVPRNPIPCIPYWSNTLVPDATTP